MVCFPLSLFFIFEQLGYSYSFLLMSLSTNYVLSATNYGSRLVFLFWFLVFACLVTFNWMLNIVNVTFLMLFFCIPINFLKLCSEKEVSYLETV